MTTSSFERGVVFGEAETVLGLGARRFGSPIFGTTTFAGAGGLGGVGVAAFFVSGFLTVVVVVWAAIPVMQARLSATARNDLRASTESIATS
jgi:hypothetical protein